jgi:hypothetical protein
LAGEKVENEIPQNNLRRRGGGVCCIKLKDRKIQQPKNTTPKNKKFFFTCGISINRTSNNIDR